MESKSAVSTYSFLGQESNYNTYRPQWPVDFALLALKNAGIEPDGAGWRGLSPDAVVPIVASIGAGAGADAATFKSLGCTVLLVEPNGELLAKSKVNLGRIDVGQAFFFDGVSSATNISREFHGRIDLIVAAQALHTMQDKFSKKNESVINAEERTRLHWVELLGGKNRDNRARISVWYYNPDPRLTLVKELHTALRGSCPQYAASNTPLFEARYHQPNYYQPYLDFNATRISELIHVTDLKMRRDDLGGWLSSYSFAPETSEGRVAAVRALETWFDKAARGEEVLKLPYVGSIAQGKLRSDRFPIEEVEDPIAVQDPFLISDGKPHFIFMSGLVCDKPILKNIMHELAALGTIHFVDYFRPELDTMDKFADYCFELINSITDARPIVLVTFSMGGYISPLLLDRMTKSGSIGRIKAVCGIESTPYDDTPERKAVRDVRLRRVQQGEFESIIEEVLNEWYAEGVAEETREESRAMIRAVGSEVYAAQMTAIRNRPDTTALQSLFKMPTLTMSAQNSALFSKPDSRYNKTAMEALKELIPVEKHRIVIVEKENAGHLVPRTHPKEVSAEIAKFLADYHVVEM